MMVDDAHASGVFGRQRPRHGRSLRHARPRRRPGRHAVEGDRRARRLRRRLAGADRVPASPRAAVPVLDVASAVGRRHLPRGARRARERAGTDRAALGQHALLQGGPAGARLRHRASARARSRRSWSATARWRCACPTGCSSRACSRRASGFRPWRTGKARVRTIVTATHTRDELQFALDASRKVGTRAGSHLIRDRDPSMNVPPLPRRRATRPLLRGLHAGPDDDRSRAAVHARHAGGLPLLLAQHRLRRAAEAAVAPARRRARARCSSWRSRSS